MTKSQNPFLTNLDEEEVRKFSNDSSFSMETASAAIDKAFSSLDHEEANDGIGEITVGVDVVKQNPIFDNDFERDTSSPIEYKPVVNTKDNDMSESSDEEEREEFISIKAVEPAKKESFAKENDHSVSETEFMSLKATSKEVDTSYDDTEYCSMKAHETSADDLEVPTKETDTSVSDTEYCVEAKLEIKLEHDDETESNHFDSYKPKESFSSSNPFEGYKADETNEYKDQYNSYNYEEPKTKDQYDAYEYEAPKANDSFDGYGFDAPKAKESFSSYTYEAPKVDDDESAYFNMAPKKASIDGEYVYNAKEETCSYEKDIDTKESSSYDSSDHDDSEEEVEPAPVHAKLSFSAVPDDQELTTVVTTQDKFETDFVDQTDSAQLMDVPAQFNNVSVDASNNNIDAFARSRSSSHSSATSSRKSSVSKTSTEEHQEVDYVQLHSAHDNSSHVDTTEQDDIDYVAQQENSSSYEEPVKTYNDDISDNIDGAAFSTSLPVKELAVDNEEDEKEYEIDEANPMTNQFTAEQEIPNYSSINTQAISNDISAFLEEEEREKEQMATKEAYYTEEKQYSDNEYVTKEDSYDDYNEEKEVYEEKTDLKQAVSLKI